MEQKEIIKHLKIFLQSHFPQATLTLTDTTDLLNDWLVESLGIVMLISFIEKQFSISLDQSDIGGENFENLLTLSLFIQKKTER